MSESGQWPAMSNQQIEDTLCAPGENFEMDTIDIRGVQTRVWKNCVATLPALAEHSRAHGECEFIVYEDDRMTFEGFYRATANFAAFLESKGVKKGDRVALAMANLPEWPVIFFAATCIGAIVVPLNAWWKTDELNYGLENSGSKVLVCDEQRWDRIAPRVRHLDALETTIVSRSMNELPSDVLKLEDIIGAPNDYPSLPEKQIPQDRVVADDYATIFYTSGTTGDPKGALGTHRNSTTNIFSSAFGVARAALRRGEALPEPQPRTTLLVIPLFHVTACCARLMGTIFGGHKLVFMRKWDVIKAFEIIQDEKVYATGGVPTIAWQLIEHPDRDKYDLSSLEAIGYGGAPAAPELVRKIKEVFGAEPGSGWGMTETSATVTGHSAEDYLNRPDSCGPPVPVADLKIMDHDGQKEMPLGEVGELWARGPMVVQEYWNKPVATKETFIDGWVKTGDLARLDDEGFCFIVDRAKDIIIRGGENIYSSEVENVLYDHPAVTDAALVPIPHRTLGEEPGAVVHLAPGTSATEEELKQWVKSRLAIFKTPVKILFSEETLPRNANGKILKTELKKLFINEDAAG